MTDQYKNIRWEIGKKNKFGNECYKLYFTQFDDEQFVIGFVKDKDYNYWIITSPLLNIEEDWVTYCPVDEMKEHCEQMVESYIEDQISYYENILEKFIEKVK